MWKSRYWGGLLVLVGALSFGGITAQAAKWHAGTPKALRGTYVKPAKKAQPTVKFTAHQIMLQLNPPTVADRLTKVSYRRVNAKTYTLKGHYLTTGEIYLKVTYRPTTKTKVQRLKLQKGFKTNQHIKWAPKHAIGWFSLK